MVAVALDMYLDSLLHPSVELSFCILLSLFTCFYIFSACDSFVKQPAVKLDISDLVVFGLLPMNCNGSHPLGGDAKVAQIMNV